MSATKTASKGYATREDNMGVVTRGYVRSYGGGISKASIQWYAISAGVYDDIRVKMREVAVEYNQR